MSNSIPKTPGAAADGPDTDGAPKSGSVTQNASLPPALPPPSSTTTQPAAATAAAAPTAPAPPSAATARAPSRRSTSSRTPADPSPTRPKRTNSKAAASTATTSAAATARFENNEVELVELSSRVADVQVDLKRIEKAADKDRDNRKLWQDKTALELSALREQSTPPGPRDPSFVPRVATLEGRVQTMLTWRDQVDVALRSLQNLLADESDDPDVLTLNERNIPLWKEVSNLYEHTREIRVELTERIDNAILALDMPAVLRRIEALEDQSRNDDQRIAELEATVARITTHRDDYPRPAPPPSFRRDQERRARRGRVDSDGEDASDEDAHRGKRARRRSPSPPPPRRSPSPPSRRRRRSPSTGSEDDSNDDNDDHRPSKRARGRSRQRSDRPRRSSRSASHSPAPFHEHSPEYERSISPPARQPRRIPSPAPAGSTLAEAQAAALAAAAAARRPPSPPPPPRRRIPAPQRTRTPPPVPGPSSRPEGRRSSAFNSGPVLGYFGNDECRTARIGADPKWLRLPWGLDCKGDNGARSRALLEHWWYMVDPTAGIPIPTVTRPESLHANWRIITFNTREDFLLFITAWQDRPEDIQPVTVVPVPNLAPDAAAGASAAAPSNDIFPSNLPPAFQGPRSGNPGPRKGPRDSGNGKGKGRGDF